MKVAVIDNTDSFVYNLVQYIGELGAQPTVRRNDSSLEEIEEIEPDRIVISPGPKTSKDSGISPEVVKKLGKEIPTLGVCLEHQAIAYAFGGKISPADRLMHGKTSMINHNGGKLYRDIPNPFEATRYHSLAVDQSTLPNCFRVTARTMDEHREIMGIEHEKYPIMGVQFHPESILTPLGKRIVENFLEGIKR
ncbi:anthranilate synthase [candidate division MSBL1 archaeon SCGC-AAA259I07]|uniref:anthranilate synthase n=1 Tax=candidate division MSBL1 archaeon SCGC-AAA259I07 TaxID=1698266 RepID=A0A133UKB5_9EURY|nr:anthranilate synthase [candidate division MSBL1 archaeon SCGC-AAA259I07]